MKLKLRHAIAVAILVIMTFPAATAHIGSEVNPRSYGTSVSCSATSSSLPSDNVCIRNWLVPSGASHVHNTFFFPLGFVGDLSINIKEPIPVVGDYVTYYYRQCSSVVPYNDIMTPTCAGGQGRDWHAGLTHRWTGAGDAKACAPLYCYWSVSTVWY